VPLFVTIQAYLTESIVIIMILLSSLESQDFSITNVANRRLRDCFGIKCVSFEKKEANLAEKRVSLRQIIIHKMNPLTVTSPLLPDLEELAIELRKIWDKKWITNNGDYHQLLETALAKYLGVEYISLFTNGTLPLLTALQALDIREGEVITSPYSFVATTHAIWWNGLTPVFVDIDPKTGNIDPEKIEAAITDRTRAILPVHVYGNPCDTQRIQAIADKHNLKVIYDAAHAFGVKVNDSNNENKSILLAGDISTLSFHATKVYNTIEGGAMVVHSAEMKRKIDDLKNFGFHDEVTVVAPGINSKMDEIRAAYGLLNLKLVDHSIEDRKKIVQTYREALRNIPGISFFNDIPGVKYNYGYFPIFINEKEYGRSRDELYYAMQAQGILGRRYFYPLISDFPMYRNLPSAKTENLPNARLMADSVICLPLSHDMSESDAERVVSAICIP